MFSAKRKKPEAKAPIPQWKLDMMAAEASQSSATGASPSKSAAADADADAAKRARVDADAGASSSAAPPPPPPDDDDDDDDDVDLSAYQLEDDDDEEEARGPKPPAWPAYAELTREEMLLRREMLDGGGPKSRKTFLVEDNENSIEKSAGSERSRIAWEMKASSRGRDAGSGPWQKHRR